MSHAGCLIYGCSKNGPRRMLMTANVSRPSLLRFATQQNCYNGWQKLCAGGPTVSPSSNAASPESPDQPQHHQSSSPPVPQTAASTSGPPAPFGSPLPQAPFGSVHQRPAFGSALQNAAEWSSSTRAAHRHAPFGSPLQAPAFGSGSGSAFGSPAFFTPAASVPHQGTTAAPQSTIAFGGLPPGTPDSAFATPASAFGTPLSGFGSPAFHTPAGTAGGQGFGTPVSRGQAFGTPIPAFGTPAASGGQEVSEDGPFGAPAFGSEHLILLSTHQPAVSTQGQFCMCYLLAVALLLPHAAVSILCHVENKPIVTYAGQVACEMCKSSSI